jgi:hypothetical protein
MIFLAWARYINYCYRQADHPLVNLAISDPFSKWWYFGDLKYRFSPAVWVKGSWRILTSLFGSFALAALLSLSFVWRVPSKLGWPWLAGSVVATFIFFHLVLAHSHYYLMFAPAAAILCAQASARLAAAVTAASPGGRSFLCASVLLALALSTVQGIVMGQYVHSFDEYPYAMAKVIRQYTTESDKLVIQGGGWGGQLLFLSDRKGLSVWDTKTLENQETYAHLKELGFTKLVMVSESPLLAAIKHVSSTSPTPNRESYRINATSLIDGWPTVIQNEDILIKVLP